MIRLTVLYNLLPNADEEEFLSWRLSEHQDSNLAIEGVVRADFSRIEEAWPPGAKSPYRFMTTMDWQDRESFGKGFYRSQVQADLHENMKKLSAPVFLIGEVLIDQRKEPDAT
ncbi:MAG: hypothetical protein ACC628_05860 [Pirellulaceae bacterium]